MVNTSHVYLNTPGSSFTDRKAIAKKCIESHQDKRGSIRRGKLRCFHYNDAIFSSQNLIIKPSLLLILAGTGLVLTGWLLHSRWLTHPEALPRAATIEPSTTFHTKTLENTM